MKLYVKLLDVKKFKKKIPLIIQENQEIKLSSYNH